MFYQPSSGLHQPLLQAGQGPVLDPSGQTQPPRWLQPGSNERSGKRLEFIVTNIFYLEVT
jgi:hypothetical protein